MSENESRALTPAERQKARTDQLVAAVEQRHEQLAILLEDSGIPFKRFVEVFRRALIQNPDLLQADPGSVIQACINACTDGLLPDGRQGALVVRSVNVAPKGKPKQYVKKASWQPMVQGLLQIAYDSGNFRDIQARVVYEGDDWDYELGIDPKIRHKPKPRPARQDGAAKIPIIAAYAVAKTKDGGLFVEVFEGEDIRKVRSVAAATSGPWATWDEEMTRKGPVRRMWKYLPKNRRMERVIEHDDDNYDQDLLIPEEDAAPKLKTGFAPRPQPALTQDATPTMPEVRERETLEQQSEVVQENIRDAMGMDEPPLPDSADDYGEQDVPDVIVDTFEEDEEQSPPAGDTYPPRIQEFRDRLATCQSWLNIKQAIRSLLKAEDWSRPEWERIILSWAWARKEELGDRTDFVIDSLLFLAWLEGADPSPDADAIRGNLTVLEAQADYKRAPEEIQEWVQRRVRELVAE